MSASSYYSYYYWADGPEAGQQVPTSLWCSGEPNNSDSGRYGEYCVVASYNGATNFNDFAPYNTNPIGYFLEFSTYDGGTTGGTNKNSFTISRVLYDGNGKTSGTVPATQAKVSSSNLTLATNSEAWPERDINSSDGIPILQEQEQSTVQADPTPRMIQLSYMRIGHLYQRSQHSRVI